jgi:hypothetical protein
MIRLAKGPFATLDSYINERYIKTGETVLKVTKSAELIEGKIDHQYVKAGDDFSHAAAAASTIEGKIEDFSSAPESKPWVGHHPEKSLMNAENFMLYGDYVADFDLRVVDGAVNQAGKSTWVVSATTADFDLGVVDGVVNGIAKELHRYGDLFRRSVTGLINDYTGGIVAGAIMLWVFIMIGVK